MSWKRTAVERMSRGLVWFFRLVKGWLPRVLGGAASLAFIIWGVNGGAVWTSGIWWFWAGIVLAAFAFVAEFVVQQPSYMKLSQLREAAEIKAEKKSDALERAVEILLMRVGKYCKLEGHSDRLSVYAFHDDQFFMVARHSKSPVYSARRRASYPAGAGAIGKAWDAEQGQALVTMPAAKEAWNKAARKQGISEEAIEGMKMRSLGLAGFRLESAEQSVGILVIESTTPGRIKQEHLDQLAESHIVGTIAELVAAFALMTPAGESFTATNGAKPERKWQVVPPFGPQTA